MRKSIPGGESGVIRIAFAIPLTEQGDNSGGLQQALFDVKFQERLD